MGFGAINIQFQKDKFMKMAKTESNLRTVIIELIKMKKKLVKVYKRL